MGRFVGVFSRDPASQHDFHTFCAAAMSYSVEAGPINFGSILPEQADEELSEAGPFLEVATAADVVLAKDAAETIKAQGLPALHEAVGQTTFINQAALGSDTGPTVQQPCARPQLHVSASFEDCALASDAAQDEQAQHASCGGAAPPPMSSSSTLPEAAASWDKDLSSLPGQLRAEHLVDAEVVHEAAAFRADQPAGHCKRLGDQGAAPAVHEHSSSNTAGGCTPAKIPDIKQETGCTDSSADTAIEGSSTAPALAAASEHATSASNSMTVLPGSSPR